MRKKHILLAAVVATTCFQPVMADLINKSKYSGQEKREIKSLSPADITELERGGGWGMAKVAELNGLPGPAHLIELKDEIELTGDQLNEIQILHDKMKVQAIESGKRLIMLEEELETRFQSEFPTDTELKAMLTVIEQTRSQLRFIHLSTHLRTPHILTKKQIEIYNKLRGYTSKDLCEHIPKGHDAVMWRKHNQCE